MIMARRQPDYCFFVIILLAVGRFISSGSAQLPQVAIPQGVLLGKQFTTRYNRTVSGFLGIPYAQPPIGELRFSDPVAAGGWSTTLNASVTASDCLQFSSGLLVGAEDCLYLNVYTPQLPQNGNLTLLPVLVYIHGGEFVKGSGSPTLYGPEFLLDKDVVLVVPNYRLGTLGFFSTGDEVASGNWGLKDSVLALQWVRDNVAYFGGDPTRVTLCGHSAGGTAAQLLTFSNSTIGLFHRYIMESGSAMMPISQSKNTSASRAIQLGEHLSCSTTSTSNLVACLRGMTSTAIMNTNALFSWLPTEEPDIEGALLIDTPENLYVAGQARDIPLMAGVTRDEGAMLKKIYAENPDAFQEVVDNIGTTILNDVSSDRYENTTALIEAVKAFYFTNLTADLSILVTNFSIYRADILFRYPAWSGLQKHLSFAESPQYFYSFEYRGTFSYAGGSTENYGVAHGDELLYLFPQTETLFDGRLTTESDLAMVDILVELWTSFAINGTPVTSAFNGTWEPYSSNDNHLRIGNESDLGIAVEYGFYDERLQFWHALPARLNTSAAASILSNLFLTFTLVILLEIRS